MGKRPTRDHSREPAQIDLLSQDPEGKYPDIHQECLRKLLAALDQNRPDNTENEIAREQRWVLIR